MKLHTLAVAALIALAGPALAQAPATKAEPKSDKAAVTKDTKAAKKTDKSAPKTEATPQEVTQHVRWFPAAPVGAAGFLR